MTLMTESFFYLLAAVDRFFGRSSMFSLSPKLTQYMDFLGDDKANNAEPLGT